MRNGFIFDIFNSIVNGLNYLNLVEFFKFIAKSLSPANASTDLLKKNVNIAIDVFIVMKWFLIVFLWINKVNTPFWIFFTFYLIWSNMHTYFNYHLWMESKQSDLDRDRRRFISLILAIVFFIVSYGYLYSVVYADHFSWINVDGLSKNMTALIYSVSQTIFIGSGLIYPTTKNGVLLVISETLVSFLFVVVLISRSLPESTIRKQTKVK